MTSQAIKLGQYAPAAIDKVAKNCWHVASESEDKPRTVTRHKRKFTCDCPAVSQTCYHVTSVVMRELRVKGWVGQVWTTYQEAKRQRRKIWVFSRNGRYFWMTGRPAPEVKRPHKRGRFIDATTDIFRYRRLSLGSRWLPREVLR